MKTRLAKVWRKGRKNPVVHAIEGGSRKYRKDCPQRWAAHGRTRIVGGGDLNHERYDPLCHEWMDGKDYNYSSDFEIEVTCKRCLKVLED